MSLCTRLGLFSLALATFAAPAHAEEHVFEARYATRAGVQTLAVSVDVSTPRGGEARVDADGQGLRAVAAGDGNVFAVTLGVDDGGAGLTLQAPSRGCTASRSGDGCWFDLPVVNSRGNHTGVTARVMIASPDGAIHPELYTERVAGEAFADVLSTEFEIDARPSNVDVEVYVEFEYDDIFIDFTPFEEEEDDVPPASAPLDLDVWRVLTYNVAALPQTAGSDDDFGPDDDYVARGHDIADWILAKEYDVVVLNEVFADEMRDTLVSDLKATFPHVIVEAWGNDGDGTHHRQDSGLMVFSRFPGSNLDLGVACDDAGNVTTLKLDDGDGSSTCSAAFWPFHDLDGEDSWAEKGVFWARFRNPTTGRHLSVLGSHTQATYDPIGSDEFIHDRAVRKSNLDEIRAVMDLVERPGEDMLVMGDLNVMGDYAGADSEYIEEFGVGGSFPTAGVEDMWRKSTSPDDMGYSWDGSDGPTGNMVANNGNGTEERLDYILSRGDSAYTGDQRAPCFQHMQLRRDFEGVWGDLSDHYGVDAVIGWDSERCDPKRALLDATGGVLGEIAYRGAYQWYRFDKPGTYTLQVYSPDLDLEVTLYDATDLSTPLGYFEGDGTFVEDDRETTSVLDTNGPFYLRVRAKNAGDTGNYKLTLNENRGTSFKDYIVLESGEKEVASFGEVLVGNAQDHLYFRFKQRALWTTNAGFQMHTLDADVCPDAACSDATVTIWDSAKQPIFTSGPDHLVLFEQTDTLPNVNDAFFVTIDRSGENVQREVELTWWTDLKVVSLLDLTCHTQEDYTGDDDIYANILVDGVSPAAGNTDLWYGQIDTNGNLKHPLSPPGFDVEDIAFKSTIEIELYEYDVNDPDDFLGSDTILNGGADGVAYTNSTMPDPDVDAIIAPLALVFFQDGAEYDLNWHEIE